MNAPLILQHVKPDAQRKLLLELPPEMGDEVTIHIYPAGQPIPEDALLMAKLFEETAFARNVLSNPVEDVWNEL